MCASVARLYSLYEAILLGGAADFGPWYVDALLAATLFGGSDSNLGSSRQPFWSR